MPQDKKNSIKINLDSKIYPLEAIIGAGYAFIDRAFTFLDSEKKNKISVTLKSKSQAKKTDKLRDEFMNELLFNMERINAAKRNKKIREFIVGRALFSAVDFTDSVTMSSEDDPLGITVPLE